MAFGNNSFVDFALEGIRFMEIRQKRPKRMVCGFAVGEYLGDFGNSLFEILAKERRSVLWA
jgi:hypothetical protein